jgi:DNA-binding ferritin-like protein
LSRYEKKLTIQKNNQPEDPVIATLKLKTIKSAHANEENSVSMLEQLKQIAEQLLVEKRQIIDTLDKWQHIFDKVTDKKSRLLGFMEKEAFT